jgi:hypothetical protein
VPSARRFDEREQQAPQPMAARHRDRELVEPGSARPIKPLSARWR